VLKLISLSGKKSKNLDGLNLSDLGVKTYLLAETCLVFSGKNLSVLESKIRESIKLSARGGTIYLPVENMSCLLGENLSVLESKIREYKVICPWW
jgi:hypothetical protein